MANHRSKIFVVGLHKTGTTSLKRALKDAGYKVARPFGMRDKELKTNGLTNALSQIDDYDAFQDDPWYLYYQFFHENIRDAKFILTTRKSSLWYKSALKHFGGDDGNEARKLFYGDKFSDPTGNRDLWISRKERHEKEVREYFCRYPNVFLEMNIAEGDNWRKLGPFIGYTPQSLSFPKVNTSTQRAHHDLWNLYTQSSGVKKFELRLKMKLLRTIDRYF